MPRNNVICDQCKKDIGEGKLTYFSDVENDLDFCSENCYSKWTNEGNWENICLDFTFELKKQWKEENFSYEACKEWVDVGLKPEDADYAGWLRDVKRISANQVLNYEDDQKLRKEHKEYKEWFEQQLALVQKNWTEELTNKNKEKFNAQELLDKVYPKEVRKGVVEIDISSRNLQGQLNVEGFINLKQLNLSGNSVTRLDLSDAINLEELDCSQNQLISLDISKLPNLKELNCAANYLDELEIPNFSDLQILKCFANNITNLDVSSCTNLQELWCYANRLINMNVNGCSSLQKLFCQGCELVSLDLSELTSLESLVCAINFFTTTEFLLQIPHPEKLVQLNISDNNFSPQSLDFLTRFINLEWIDLGNKNKERVDKGIYNHFYGSLEPLRTLTRLRELHIDDTDVCFGLEYLVVNGLENIFCENNIRIGAGVVKLQERMQLYEQVFKEVKDDEGGKKITLEEEFGISPQVKDPQKLIEKGELSQLESELTDYRTDSDIVCKEIADQNTFTEKNIKELGDEYDGYRLWSLADAHYLSGTDKNKTEEKEVVVKENWNQQENWESIHPSFGGYPEMREDWENLGFNFRETKRWMDSGLKISEHNFAAHLKRNGFTPEQYAGFRNKDAQEWIDYFYPLETRADIKELNLSKIILFTPDEEKLTGSLKLKGFINLEKLDCSSNRITNLDVSNCVNLKELECSWGEVLTDLNLTGLIKIEKLKCIRNSLTSLDLNQCPNLKELECGSNRLLYLFTSFARLNKLQLLSCSGNKLFDLDLTVCPNITKLFVSNNYLTNLELNQTPYLKEINCSSNWLSSLSISNLVDLKIFYCDNNKLTNLHLVNCPLINSLGCSFNYLTNLDFLISLPNEKLEVLNISDNNFPTTDLNFFSKFVSLLEFKLGNSDEKRIEKGIYNHWNGSLEPLKNLTKLRKFDIQNTNIERGLEYLPYGLLDFCCDNDKKKDAGCREIVKQLEKEKLQFNSPVWIRNWKAKRGEKLEKEEGKEWKEASENAKKIFLLKPWIKEQIRVQIVPREELEQIIREKTGIKGKIIDIEFFSTWFNPNCAIVTNKVVYYAVRLVVYEPALDKIKDDLFVKRFPKNPVKWYSSLEKVRVKSQFLKEKLNSDNPIFALTPKIFFPSEVVRNIFLPADTNPEEHLKPLDIVWRKINTFGYHAAVYLGNNKVAHISSNLTDDFKNNAGTIVGEWKKFLKGTRDNLVRYHMIIPFKRPKKILDHIACTTFAQHAKGQYDLFKKNCEHFATLCVCGVSFSWQVPLSSSINDLERSIRENNKGFESMDLKQILMRSWQSAWDKLYQERSRIEETWEEGGGDPKWWSLNNWMYQTEIIVREKFRLELEGHNDIVNSLLETMRSVGEKRGREIECPLSENEVKSKLQKLNPKLTRQQEDSFFQAYTEYAEIRRQVNASREEVYSVRNNPPKKIKIKEKWFASHRQLTDQEIDWALEKLVSIHSRTLRYHVLPACQFRLTKELLVSKIYPYLNEPNAELIFIPIDSFGFCWSLLVYEIKTKRFFYWDASQTRINYKYTKQLVKEFLQWIYKEDEIELSKHLIIRNELEKISTFDDGMGVIYISMEIMDNEYNGPLNNLPPIITEDLDFSFLSLRKWLRETAKTGKFDKESSMKVQWLIFLIKEIIPNPEYKIDSDDSSDEESKFKPVFDESQNNESVSKIHQKSAGWGKIHPGFTCDLVRNWRSLGFTYEKTKNWVNIGFLPTDHNLVTFLIINQGYTVETLTDNFNIENFRSIYQEYLQVPELQSQVQLPPK